MSGQAGLPGMTSAAVHEADLRAREDDPTPRGVVRAILAAWRAAVNLCVDQPQHVLDVCAGYGCWASEMRRLAHAQGWPVHMSAIEIDGRKGEHLRKWADSTRIGNVYDCLQPKIDHFDLVIGNPAFSLLVPKARPCETVEAAVERSILGRLLAAAPAVIQLHHLSAFVRGRVGNELWERYPAARQWIIPGAVSFRSDGKTDLRCYAASLWLRGHRGDTVNRMLPRLSREELRWRTLPGTEEPSDDLPAAPGWSR